MPDTLRNPRLERALMSRLVEVPSVDGDYGIVCTLVPRCEGIIARFTVRDTSTVPSEVVGERNETWSTAVHHIVSTYDVGTLTAANALRRAEEDAWQRLYDMGYDVPEEYRGA